MLTCSTPGYHPSQTKWHLAPDFTVTSLSEDATISSAVSIVLQAKDKHLSQTETQILVSQIEQLSRGNTIKHLYNLTDKQWNALDSHIPKICAIYLRHLLVQSFKYKSKLQLLEHDFNHGLSINWTDPKTKSIIDQLLGLGFTFDDCAEAVIVNNHSLSAAIDYVLLDQTTKLRKYESQKRKLNRMCVRTLNDSDYHLYTQICGNAWEQKENDLNLVRKWGKLTKSEDICAEIDTFKQRLMALKQSKTALQMRLNSHKLQLYSHFVMGILANKELNALQVTQWRTYRTMHNISANEHRLVLNKFGYESEDDLDRIKTYIQSGELLSVSKELVRYDSNGSCHSVELTESTTKMVTNDTNGNNECVICYEERAREDKTYMLCPCFHICLCAECALKYYSSPHKEQKCPICCAEIADLKQVFFS